jgi:hypothetical protein
MRFWRAACALRVLEAEKRTKRRRMPSPTCHQAAIMIPGSSPARCTACDVTAIATADLDQSTFSLAMQLYSGPMPNS